MRGREENKESGVETCSTRDKGLGISSSARKETRSDHWNCMKLLLATRLCFLECDTSPGLEFSGIAHSISETVGETDRIRA